MTRRVKLTVAYIGSSYSGWQRQASQRSVQGELEHAIRSFTGGLKISVVGAGRTDAGVHARGQVAHVDLPQAIPLKAVVSGLNARLPASIRIRRAQPAKPGFHARFDARAKLYVYRVRWVRSTLPWRDQRAAELRSLTHRDNFALSLEYFRGTRDMASFTTPECAARVDTMRRLLDLHCHFRRGGLDLEFLGDGFLRYQVRRMVGALFQVGWGQLSLTQFAALLDTPEPGACSLTAPAGGLTLEKVFYRTPASACQRPVQRP